MSPLIQTEDVCFYLSVIGMSVISMSVIGMSVISMSVIGMSVISMSVIGMSVISMSVASMSVISMSVTGGYVWGVNTQLFFQDQGQTSTQIGEFMSWIPLVGGSIGAFFGGFISDRFVKKRGVVARMVVLVISQVR